MSFWLSEESRPTAANPFKKLVVIGDYPTYDAALNLVPSGVEMVDTGGPVHISKDGVWRICDWSRYKVVGA